MRMTLAAFEKRSVNSSGGVFTVISISTGGLIELSAKGLEDIPLEPTDQIKIADAKQLSLQNVGAQSVDIEFTILSTMVDKKSHYTKTEIVNSAPIKIEMDRDVAIGAVNQDGLWNVGVINAATNTHKARVSCAAGVSTQLFAAGARKSVRLNIRAEQFNGVSMGGDSSVTDASGGFLDVGMVDYIDTSGALWAFNNGASSVLIDVLELI
jgi:hypothetical protein